MESYCIDSVGRDTLKTFWGTGESGRGYWLKPTGFSRHAQIRLRSQESQVNAHRVELPSFSIQLLFHHLQYLTNPRVPLRKPIGLSLKKNIRCPLTSTRVCRRREFSIDYVDPASLERWSRLNGSATPRIRIPLSQYRSLGVRLKPLLTLCLSRRGIHPNSPRSMPEGDTVSILEYWDRYNHQCRGGKRYHHTPLTDR